MKGVKHFKSVASYHRWLAFGHRTGVFKVPGNQKVYVRGVLRRVVHKRK